MHILATTIFSLLAVTASANVINRSSPTSSTPSTPSYLPCTTDKECGTNSYCDKRHQRCVGLGFSEEECTVNWDCISNWCLDGKCQGIDAVGKPCNNTDTDCSFYVRHGPYRDGEYTFCPKDTGGKPRTCMRGYLGQGDKCTLNEQCGWDNCVNGVCETPAGQLGTSCKAQSDCVGGLTCTYQITEGRKKSCERPEKGYFGSPCNTDGDCATRNCGLYGEKFCNAARPSSCGQIGTTCFSDSSCCSNQCVPSKGYYVCG